MEKIKKNDTLIVVLIINYLIFILNNLVFDIKYEQVDDFIIYNLYSGLDGTYNFHGIYIHPLICIILSMFFRIIPQINWHSIFLLSMQFICFTIIGYIILKKHKNPLSIILYTLFASVFYTSLLLLIQYTSVAGLLILTSLFIIIDLIEQNKISKKWLITSAVLFTIGIMVRMQSLLIIVPFFAIYAVYYLVKFKYKKASKEQIMRIIKYYSILILITAITYISNCLIYNTNSLYKSYMEYNEIRAQLQDLSYTSYEENKEIFDEIGWSQNDHYIFYTFNFGDENKYSKENLQKIIDYKKEKNEYYNINGNIFEVIKSLKNEMIDTNTFISLIFFASLILALFNKDKVGINILIFATTIATHALFIILNRSMLRVVIPEYIIGTALIIYNLDFKAIKEISMKKIAIATILIMVISIDFSGKMYNFGYKLDSYSNYKDLIEYTNSHKENVYLYTVPALQFRYLVYSVYEMPPKSAFSNLRVMGGWDMFTENYYDFKERYNLDGTFLDLLKENVYLIDGDVIWSGRRYSNYKENVILFIKENYAIDVKYEKIEEFNNLCIYKLERK